MEKENEDPQAAQNLEQFKGFLKVEANLDDQTIELLIDAGFDDFESLALAEEETFQFLGFDDPGQVFKSIKAVLSDEILESSRRMGGRDSNILAQGILDQDNDEIDDLQAQMEQMKMGKMQSDSVNPSAQKAPIDFIELDGKTTPISS